MKIKHVTIIGGGDEDHEQHQQEILRSMLSKNMINLPGQTPMNTQMDEDN